MGWSKIAVDHPDYRLGRQNRYDEILTELSEDAFFEPGGMMPSPIHVLVVDDEPSIRNSLVEFLKDCRFVVSAAESAESALALIDHTPIDVAIVDIRLPRLDGDSFILQAHQRCPRMRFLIHTGSVEYKLPDELKAFGVGPDHVFLKPQMDLSVFETAIHKMVGVGE
jgi:CheY-like chemotaxis protein